MIRQRKDFQFVLEEPGPQARQRCLQAIQTLGWQLRHDLTKEYDLVFYVPIPTLLPNAPVYFISLYPDNQQTTIVMEASADDISRQYADNDLPRLRATILNAPPPERETPPPAPSGQASKQCFLSYRRYDSAE